MVHYRSVGYILCQTKWHWRARGCTSRSRTAQVREGHGHNVKYNCVSISLRYPVSFLSAFLVSAIVFSLEMIDYLYSVVAIHTLLRTLANSTVKLMSPSKVLYYSSLNNFLQIEI